MKEQEGSTNQIQPMTSTLSDHIRVRPAIKVQELEQRSQNQKIKSLSVSSSSYKYKIPEVICEAIRRKAQQDHPIPVEPAQAGNEKSKMMKSRKKHKKRRQVKCMICEIPKPIKQFLKVGHCEHSFCPSCLHQYIIYRINSFESVECPDESCHQTLSTNSTLYSQLPLEARKKYKKILEYQKVLNNTNLRLCPSEDCDGYLEGPPAQEGVISIVNPSCNVCHRRFCPNCSFEEHDNECKSHQLAFFQETLNYRRCNRCKNMIQKSSGCNHMTCRCGYQFCYICGARWNHAHRCNNPEGEPIFEDAVCCECCEQCDCQEDCDECCYRCQQCCGECCQCCQCCECCQVCCNLCQQCCEGCQECCGRCCQCCEVCCDECCNICSRLLCPQECCNRCQQCCEGCQECCGRCCQCCEVCCDECCNICSRLLCPQECCNRCQQCCEGCQECCGRCCQSCEVCCGECCNICSRLLCPQECCNRCQQCCDGCQERCDRCFRCQCCEVCCDECFKSCQQCLCPQNCCDCERGCDNCEECCDRCLRCQRCECCGWFCKATIKFCLIVFMIPVILPGYCLILLLFFVSKLLLVVLSGLTVQPYIVLCDSPQLQIKWWHILLGILLFPVTIVYLIGRSIKALFFKQQRRQEMMAILCCPCNLYSSVDELSI